MLVGLLLVSGVLFVVPQVAGSTISNHAPILIDGNAGFTFDNGVRNGSGTPSDPYIISNWDIDLSQGCYCLGVQVQNTNAYFAILSVYVHDGGIDGVDIRFSNVTNGRVEGSTLFNSAFGISITSSKYITISENNITVPIFYIDRSEVEGPCLHVTSSSNITVFGNNFSSCANAGMDLTGGSGDTNLVLSNNNFSGDGDGVGIFLGTVSYSTITNNRFSQNDIDIYVLSGASLTHNNISGNNFNGMGIYLQPSYLTLSSNTISTDNLVNGKPIYYFEGCSGTGPDDVPVGQLIAVDCTNFHVSNLRIENVVESIVMISVHGASVTNVSANAMWYGVLALDSDRVTISSTNVTAVYGIQFYRTSSMLVYHNNLLCAGSWCDVAEDYQGTNNLWDNGYPSGGNFWYNYPGLDNCSGAQQSICTGPDGIGDTASWRDMYPLMKPVAVSTDPTVAISSTGNFRGVTVTTSGSIAIDSGTVSGTISVTATNSSTGTILFSKTYIVKNVEVTNGDQAEFLLNVPVRPRPLSVDIMLSSDGGAWSASVGLIRQLVIAGHGAPTPI